VANLDTPRTRYRAALAADNIRADTAQKAAVERLEDLYHRLAEQESQLVRRRIRNLLPVLGRKPKLVRGLYFWGGVGRGKTYIVDVFFECLPFKRKRRMHFHLFMQRIHAELKGTRDMPNPLGIIARKLATEFRVLCFDEFVVNDVADAVILGRLLEELFRQGVTLVATSNIEPDELYRGGLQRDLFLPAIALIKVHTEVFHLDGGKDYRLQFLDSAETYFTPPSDAAMKELRHNFDNIAPEAGTVGAEIEINGRRIPAELHADGVAWFDFAVLCGGPRSQEDYIELARCFHTIILSDVPVLDGARDDAARRLINLIDVMYDHNVNILVSAKDVPEGLYRGSRLSAEFRRTVSRLTEMRSHDYLARGHIC
jgi:cell division protein ZapE